ncbi:hypothetical protein CCHR01_09327 [Colletotrichum chrysophilum]|uniref:Uncharacterized protein n=1 Tax=Colletotrichum chrysophilum TaxID=1836956 RepID=A0AAD9ALZ0_9PEZI|nr:hypothetical protein CCHR01_09327 [Colletotrichum chrysophilum]
MPAGHRYVPAYLPQHRAGFWQASKQQQQLSPCRVKSSTASNAFDGPRNYTYSTHAVQQVQVDDTLTVSLAIPLAARLESCQHDPLFGPPPLPTSCKANTKSHHRHQRHRHHSSPMSITMALPTEITMAPYRHSLPRYLRAGATRALSTEEVWRWRRSWSWSHLQVEVHAVQEYPYLGTRRQLPGPQVPETCQRQTSDLHTFHCIFSAVCSAIWWSLGINPDHQLLQSASSSSSSSTVNVVFALDSRCLVPGPRKLQ